MQSLIASLRVAGVTLLACAVKYTATIQGVARIFSPYTAQGSLIARAEAPIACYGATPERPLPPELAAASGSGLDPHISEHAALYQAGRVSQARGLPLEQVEALVRAHASTPSALLAPERRINVLELNLALDALSLPR